MVGAYSPASKQGVQQEVREEIEQKILKFSWVFCRIAELRWVLHCWSDIVAKLPHNCAMEIKQKNKYFHALIMLALLQIRSLSVIVTGPDHNTHTIYTQSGCPELRKTRSGFHFCQSWESFKSLKSKIKPTKPSSPPYPPQGAVESRGFLGNYTDHLLCSISGVLIQALGPAAQTVPCSQQRWLSSPAMWWHWFRGKERGGGRGEALPFPSVRQTVNWGRSRSCLGLSSKWQLFDWQKATMSMLCL